VKYFISRGFKKLLNPFLIVLFLSTSGISFEFLSIALDNSLYASSIVVSKSINLNNNLNFIIPPPQDSTEFAPPDSGFIKAMSDSTAADSLLADSVKIDPQKIDSTARIKHFRHSRKSKVYTEFYPGRTSAFFAKPPQGFYTRTVELDSSKQFVTIKEKYGDQEAKVFLKIPIDDFIRMKLDKVNKDNWEDIVYAYELKDLNTDLSQLLTDITNIQIPLPSASFLSIFGPPVINLRISGAVDIHGAWRSETTEGITSSRLGNTRNEPDFKQQVQINVSGTIGDKLTINADWNTERTFEYENQLKLHYKGYEDEIIQSIEAGNVSLQTSSLVGGSEALFGVKAQFQLGPLSLTALASQKKGEVKEVSVSGGSTTQPFEKRAYEYSQNHYFIDKAYADPNLNLYNDYYASANPIINPRFRIVEIEVWKTSQGYIDLQRERKVNAFIDLPGRATGSQYDPNDPLRDISQDEVPGNSVINGRFLPLEQGVDYTYNEYTGVISFTSQIQNDDQIAVAYRQANDEGSDDDTYYGEFIRESSDTSQVLLLKLVKPKNLQPKFTTAWSLQLKNIYPIGGRNVKKEGFILDIKYHIAGQEPVSELQSKKLIQLFGLDNTDDAGSANPDGAFDFEPGKTIFTKTGEIIFPTLQPFGRDFPSDLDPEKRYQAVYDTTVTFAQQEKALDKFVITGEYSASVTSTYNIGFNVVENSVKVLLNGNELRAGADYSVDYNIGQVIIRNDAALTPGADLRITYEQNDLFALASKTLVGLRGLYEFSKDTKLGFSFLNLNQQTLSDKVRIGEEPLNNSIYGLDFQTRHDLPFLTNGLSNIISTSAPSSISLKGEFAYINPDPNTKKSTIASDNNESIAYIDDFEGAKRTIPIGMSDRSWKDISIPRGMEIIENFAIGDSALMSNKGKAFWYNISPSDVTVEQIYGDRKQVAREEEQVTVLDFVFRPNSPGAYNNPADLSNPTQNWGGIMKGLSSTASNLVEENIQFIEFYLKIDSENPLPSDAKMFVDLGLISEDVIPNNVLDTEDVINVNDIEEPDEDTGIDGLFDEKEPGYDPITNPDPNNDNFFFTLPSGDEIFNPDNYVGINGTEGNREFRNAGIKLPDTEDLNRNLSLDKVNSFYRYEVSLDTSGTNEFIIGGGEGSSWYLYRIPLQDSVTSIGDPTFTVVENIRFWVGGYDQEVHLRFAEINLVGNQWQKVLNDQVDESDTTLSIGTINVEDNPAYFSPPGVFRERDRSKPDQEVFKNEQSLELLITDLENGDSREAIKYLYRPLDVFNYKEMKFFVHGDEFNGPTSSVSFYQDENYYGSEVYFRFGTDTANFYEYRQPVKAGWNEVRIIFEEITAIKEGRTLEQRSQLITKEVAEQPGHTFGVKGLPTLTSVQFFLVGILNPVQQDDLNESVSGNIWINELRVLEADDSPGWAYSTSGTVAFADLLTVNANMSKTDPYFHRLADRFGSRVDRTNWGVSLELDALKALPINLEGSNLKVNYSRNESVAKPLYIPGTDIFVDSAAAQAERRFIDDQGASPEKAKELAQDIRTNSQTISVKETWTLSNIKLKVPSNKWYFRDTFNSLVFGFNYSKTLSRNPTVSKNSSWIWNASAKYSINLSNDYFIYPANIPILGWLFSIFDDYRNVKFYFTPQNFSFNLTAKRNRTFSQNRTSGSSPNVQRDFTANRSMQFSWKLSEGGFLNPSINYSLDIASSLAHLLTGENDRERNSSAVFGDIFEGEFFGKDNNYRQSVDFKLNPSLPTLWDINRYFTLTANYNVNYNWRFNFQQDTLGRSSQFTNNIRAGLTLRWKSLTAPLFKEDTQAGSRGRTPASRSRGRSRGRNERDLDDEIKRTNIVQEDSASGIIDAEALQDSTIDDGPSTIMKFLNFMKLSAKWLFFDYDQFSINFSQQNTVANSGLKSEGTGLSNFWGFNQSDRSGPGRLYQLGLSHDPGARAPNGNLSDNFSQKNSIDFKTSRPLWEGAQIDLNWKVDWGINKTSTIQTDADGGVTITNIASSKNINRSFISFPPTFFLSSFNSGITKVAELYDPDSDDPNKSLSDAFLEGFESAPFVSKLPLLKDFTKYIPRPNWRLSWTGLEKIGFFKNFTKRVSLNHAYTSNYSEGLRISPDGNEEIQKQTVSYGFAPLIGLNLTFNDMWGGNLTGSAKYSTKTSFDLGIATRNISESFQKDISFTASFSKSGFEIPLFGVSLKNDIEISLSYTSGRNSIVIFEMDDFIEEGKPQDGTTRTTIEPRIKYVISSKVTLSLFYKSTTVVPEGAARIPETSTSEAGLDVHISIQ